MKFHVPLFAIGCRQFLHQWHPGLFCLLELVGEDSARFAHETAEERDHLGRPISQPDCAGVHSWAYMRPYENGTVREVAVVAGDGNSVYFRGSLVGLVAPGHDLVELVDKQAVF
jgi:hypothetical protein